MKWWNSLSIIIYSFWTYKEKKYNIKKCQSSKSQTYEMIKQVIECFEEEDLSNKDIFIL